MTDVKPIFYLRLWREPSGAFIWKEDTLNTPSRFRAQMDYVERFEGMEFIVYVGVNDDEATRGEMLDMATRFIRGQYVTASVDLKTLTVTYEQGVPKTPRH